MPLGVPLKCLEDFIKREYRTRVMKEYGGRKKMALLLKKYDFFILGGAGMQGRIVAKDLLESGYSVAIADIDRIRAQRMVKKSRDIGFLYLDIRDIDLTIAAIQRSGARVVINCAEGNWNLDVYRACLRAGVHCIDLGSEIEMTEAQLALDDEFKKKGLTAITGCGSVPGIGNVMLRYAARKFDTLKTIEVGFAWQSNIKRFVVPFSIESIIEEFTKPAPVIEDGKWGVRIPLKTVTMRNHRSIGRERVLIVRHPETYTFYHYYKDQGVKNVRFYAGFPPHSEEKIRSLIELGFGSVKPIKINGHGFEISPLDFTTEVLRRLKIPKGYREKENLWVVLIGKKNGHEKTIIMNCIVPTIKNWEDAGCNIDTGMPASIIAQMIWDKKIRKRGSFAPEAVVPEKYFFKELKKRKMKLFENDKRL